MVENILPPVVFYPSIIGYNMGKQLEVFDVIMSINTWVHSTHQVLFYSTSRLTSQYFLVLEVLSCQAVIDITQDSTSAVRT